jgi:hypothetical protein
MTLLSRQTNERVSFYLAYGELAGESNEHYKIYQYVNRVFSVKAFNRD